MIVVMEGRSGCVGIVDGVHGGFDAGSVVGVGIEVVEGNGDVLDDWG